MKEQKVRNEIAESPDNMTVETFVASPENTEEIPTPTIDPNVPLDDPNSDAAEEQAVEKLSKEEKFKKLAEARTTKILLMMESLGKLSSPAYKSTPEQVDAMFSAIGEAVNEAYAKYQPKQKTGKEGKAFKF